MVKGLPHDIYSIQPYVRPLWLSVLLAMLIIGIIGAIGWGLYLWYRKRKSYIPPQRRKDSWELLDDELEALRQRLMDHGPAEIRELFYGLSLVLRRAIELASGIRATDLTVQELKARLKFQKVHGALNPDLSKDIVTFLTRADLIKFADAAVETGEASMSYGAVKEWVLVLKPKPQAPMPSDTLKGQVTKGIT